MIVVTDSQILSLWQQRLSTYEIAQRLFVPESVIANRLARIKDRAAAA